MINLQIQVTDYNWYSAQFFVEKLAIKYYYIFLATLFLDLVNKDHPTLLSYY